MIILRWIWQSVILVLGIVGIILGAISIFGNPKADYALIILGVLTVIEMIYFMVRRIPRFPDSGETRRSARESTIDTLVILITGAVGIIAAAIVAAVV